MPATSPPFAEVFDRLGKVATLPALAVRIVDAASNYESDARDLAALVERDPVLVTRLLRVANSAYFSQSRKVDSIQRAITLLGNRRLANLALTILIARQFNEQPTISPISRERLWIHSASVAAIAELVARHRECCDPEQAYLAGLLHDFGILVIDQLLQEHISAIMSACENHECFSQAAQSVLTFTPGELGAYLARRSNLPESIARAIEFHTRPDDVEGGVQGGDRLTDVVHVSDYLAQRHGAAIFRNRRIIPASGDALARLDMGDTIVRELWQPIEQRLTKVQDFGLL